MLMAFISFAALLVADDYLILVANTDNTNLNNQSNNEISNACSEFNVGNNGNNNDDTITYKFFNSVDEALQLAQEFMEDGGNGCAVWGHGTGEDSLRLNDQNVNDSEFDSPYITNTYHCDKGDGDSAKTTQDMWDEMMNDFKE